MDFLEYSDVSAEIKGCMVIIDNTILCNVLAILFINNENFTLDSRQTKNDRSGHNI